ncbi:MAG: hypothetical protein FWD64_03295 [Acidobacteriaceae bacterium]|nr:hypothetical protein [Acidobacteriaceae bacterium]
MSKPNKRLYLALLFCLAFSTVAYAASKVYSLEGKVVARGTTKDVKGKKGKTKTVLSTTYTVLTPTRTYVFQCVSCGKKGLAIDDSVRFRIAKNTAYIETEKGKEHKLIVLSEASNEAAVK